MIPVTDPVPGRAFCYRFVAVCQSEKTEYSSLEETLEYALDELCLVDDVYRKAVAIRLPEGKKKAFSILLHEAIFGQTLKPDKITVSFQTPIPNHADPMTGKNSILDMLIQVEGESVSVYDFIQYDIEPGRVLRYSETASQFAVRMTGKNSILDMLIQVEGESVSVYDFIQYDIEPGRVLRYSETASQFAVRAGKPCNDRLQTNCVFITNANHFKGTRLKIFPHDEPIRIMDASQFAVRAGKPCNDRLQTNCVFITNANHFKGTRLKIFPHDEPIRIMETVTGDKTTCFRFDIHQVFVNAGFRDANHFKGTRLKIFPHDEPIRIMETVTGDKTTCFRFDIHQVFVNAGFRDNSFPGHLMQDLNETDPENITIPLL